ncbi:hypothetical protein BX616_001315 [Lobosporangium transversale]|uniref:Uncharacterized protein n=1 Tax=Lobosporangium transversale TaxID=64571 RepID=A0A1Y2GPW5_9FUNG|nr:hypothetical protein BCR41DRAFT_385947 [Lobosporangium transversale]XP_021882073.1 hypothetical protein BCR41DRAFT_385949 [Lobosporangium transversale]KAF9904403.1 hypothetical protein BX616_001315 [Lobosporangium transversale]ORZ18276.1 hypothetical protein BCR41DRAFT_385947 [Lobosporangium transversale]ORZ18278.1 hypothetical protein BCR41DRAFT_385949 [Lobosporangium transversale]|eukprot:XP_021882071.1 hypothetical protein BCR41DRAFT_385947 [Lobosporangium transversale]
MGLLRPKCLTTDNTRLYAFAREMDLATEQYHYLLLKSNDNPSFDLKDLTWSIISVVPTTGLPLFVSYPYFGDFDCVVDDQGVFSIIGKNDYDENFEDYPFNVNAMQYVPSLTPGTNGTWRNITTPTQEADYLWNRAYKGTLFNYKDAQGKNNLMHTYISSNESDVYVAALDTTSMTLKQGIGAWNITNGKYSHSSYASFANNNIYIYGEDFDKRAKQLFAFPITSASPNAPGVLPRGFNATEVDNACGIYTSSFVMQALKDDLVIFCRRGYRIHIFNGSGFTALPVINSDLEFEYMNAMVPFPGATPYLFMYNRGGSYSIPLNGSFVSSVLKGNNITIVENYGVKPLTQPNETPIPTVGASNLPANAVTTQIPNTGTEQEHSNANKGMIAGIVICILAAMAFLLFRFRQHKRNAWRKRSKSAANAAAASTVAANGAGVEGYTSVSQGDYSPYPAQHHNEKALPEVKAKVADDIWEYKTVDPVSPSIAGSTVHSSPYFTSPPVPNHSKPGLSPGQY